MLKRLCQIVNYKSTLRV